MGWRTVIISQAADLRFTQGRMSLQKNSGDEVTLPLEDIDSVVLDTCHTRLTGQLLSECSRQRTAVFVCDDKHQPCGVLLPFNSHHRLLKVIRSQLTTGKPLRKQLWQRLVRAKIRNQAEVLEAKALTGPAQHLHRLADKVRSGDPDNLEAQAAAAYFRALFGNDFARRKSTWHNAALNYAYALLRGLLARSLCAYGYQPALGLGHDNEQNAFNLADDLLEPWRPLADRWVLSIAADGEVDGDGKLAVEHKRELAALLGSEICLGDDRYSLSAAANEQVASLGRAIQSCSAEKLVIPVWAEPVGAVVESGP